MTEHQNDTRNHRETPVANHFNLNNHSPQHLKFQIIEILASDPDGETSTAVRRKKELHWIYQRSGSMFKTQTGAIQSLRFFL